MKLDSNKLVGAERDGLRLSQQCQVHGDHDRCPRETTLGTSRCWCPCHDKDEPKPKRRDR